MPTYSCSGCSREYVQPLPKLMEMIRRGRTSCQMCGEKLVFPPEATASVQAARALSEYTCPACDKTWATSPPDLRKRRRTGCVFCGAPLRDDTLAALDAMGTAPAAPVTKAELTCLVCVRKTWIESPSGEDLYRCGFCGAEHRMPGRPPPLAEPAADRADIEAVVGVLDALVRNALLARADRGEVGAGEARWIAGRLSALASWEPEPGEAYLPLSVADAEDALPPLLYPGKSCLVEETDDGTDLVFTMSARDPTDTTALFTNLAGIISVTAFGRGVFVIGGEQETADKHRLRVAILPFGDGVELELYTQLNDTTPQPAVQKAEDAFADLIAGAGPMLEAYYGTLAVFGAWVGDAAAMATVPAITQRLAQLDLHPGDVTRLCMEKVRSGA